MTSMKSLYLGTAAVGALLASVSMATAGGFAVREQSAQFQGTSFAGSGAGGGLSSMFWNSAAAAQAGPGITIDSSYSLILGNVEMTALPGSTLNPAGGSESGNIAVGALVPATYGAYRLSNGMVLAASLNAPVGLTTKPDNTGWAGRTQAVTSTIKTFNLNVVAAMNLGNGVSIGVGPQVQLMKGRLTNLTGAASFGVLEADDFGFGFTAGVLFQPAATTSIGLGFRSSIKHNLEGTLFNSAVPAALGTAGVEAGFTTPETINLSLRQALSPQLTALATIEWTNWSRAVGLAVICKDSAGACSPGVGGPGPGGLRTNLPLGWHDGWMYSAGLEYAYSPALTMRGGLAYEKSPVQNPNERTPRTPDADRIWASLGGAYKWSEKTTLEFGYSHVFIKDSTLSRVDGPITLNADVKGSVDILSFGMKTKF
jgi:long-chain fatty acid transport protein